MVGLAVLGIVFFYSLRDLMGRYCFEKFYSNAVANRLTCGDDLKRALQWDPHQLHYWNQGGYFFASKGFLKNKALAQKAINYYEASLALNPNQLELLESLGALYASFGEHQRAVEYFCKTILCLPNHTLAYVQLLEVLKQVGLDDLREEWFALSMHICPKPLLRQPDLATEFEHSSNLHRRYFEYFELLENHNTQLAFSDAWRLKKYFIKKILFNEKESALLEENAELREANWFNKLISWEKTIKQGWDEPYAKRLYFIPLKQHSNMRILLHAGVGPQLKICTIKEITKPFEFSSYPFERNIPAEKTREILLPLVEKTLKSVK